MVMKYKKDFTYDSKTVELLASALQKAVEETQCDPRCIDWFRYNPDFNINQEKAIKK
jgi:hypothetical protein